MTWARHLTVTPAPGVTPQRVQVGQLFPVPISVRVTDRGGALNEPGKATLDWSIGDRSGRLDLTRQSFD